jgi:invasion protein IalB
MALRYFATMAFTCLVATTSFADETKSPTLIYSPWIKVCPGDTCFTGSDARSVADCRPVASAVLIERTGDAKKTLRVMLPNFVVRINIDQDEAIERSFGPCFASGCLADYIAGTELIDQLRQGKMLSLKAFDKGGSPIDQSLPLAGFAGAYDGPATEPKVFEERQSDLQARLERQKRENEDRKARCGAG